MNDLTFRPIEGPDFGRIARYMELTPSRSCDYTLGGVALWADCFGYEMAEADGLLFIRGRKENELAVVAYTIPLGEGDFERGIARLRALHDDDVWLSAVPEDCMPRFEAMDVACEDMGADWSDYLYPIGQFVELDGAQMKRKRNHVNRFKADFPDARMEHLNPQECMELLHRLPMDDSPMGRAEHEAVERMLTRWADFAPYFRGRQLRAGGRIVGFTVGEVKHSTLHVHVEKADHTIAGSNEALAHLFASEMSLLYPHIQDVNRQDDAGDPGLRAAKQSWRPGSLLPKFNLHISKKSFNFAMSLARECR